MLDKELFKIDVKSNNNTANEKIFNLRQSTKSLTNNIKYTYA